MTPPTPASPTPASSSSGANPAADGGRRPIRRALVSVYDKTGIAEVGQALAAAGAEIVSTGSTAQTLRDASVAVTEVADVTGFPEVLDGRVKTLHPRIHAGLLADLRLESHRDQLAEHGIDPFDLVIVNLYPFRQAVAEGKSFDECIELIDIGGPAMVRASAKNHASVAVIVNPEGYSLVAPALERGGFTAAERLDLATRAFAETASYDCAVADYLGQQAASTPAGDRIDWSGVLHVSVAPPAQPEELHTSWRRAAQLRYGENPHQGAALYVPDSVRLPGEPAATLAGADRMDAGNKEMSYNNYVDADAALRALSLFALEDTPVCAIMKHNNPCGIAQDASAAGAYAKAFACDPVSAYGSVVAFNREVDAAAAAEIAKVFTEVLVAPGYSPEALAILSKKKNLRILRVAEMPPPAQTMRLLDGGMSLLLQATDQANEPGDYRSGWTLATEAGADLDERTMADLAFAWRAIAAVKSNAILLADGGASVGIGMGQVNRVDSARLAVERAGAERARAAVAASDAFFPFADGLQVLADAGVRAVVQPGGSIRDEEVIAAANEAGMAMFLTGVRHFTH